MAIHPTAIIDPTAELDATVEVGAYAIIEGAVRIAAGTRVYHHAFIAERTTVGQRCQIHPFTTIGHVPQDLSFDGSPTYTDIGDETVIREGATVHRGSAPESTTRVGRRCFLMSNVHIAHNCRIGDDVTIATAAALSGHVIVQDRAFLSGNSGMHQFVRIGELAMVSGGFRIVADVPPFLTIGPAGIVGPNTVGLRRAGFSAQERMEIRTCFRRLYRSSTAAFRQVVDSLADEVSTAPGRRLIEFLQSPTKRGFCGSAYRRRSTGIAAESL